MTAKTNTFVPKINEPLIRQTMTAIADDLPHWDQMVYVRRDEDGDGVKACFAGRALLLQGYTVVPLGDQWVPGLLRLVDTYGKLVDNASMEAMAEMGLTENQAVRLFGWMPSDQTTLLTSQEEQYQAFAEHVLAVTGIDCR